MRYRAPERLETARLILRMFRNEDWPHLHEYYSDEMCTRYTVGRVLTEAESWREMAARAGHWLLRGYGPYAVEEKAGGGVVGLWYPLEWPEPEVTWHLARRHFGKGFAQEAARAVLDMAREVLPEIPFISLIHPDNHASIKLAIALEASFERTVSFRNGHWCVYRHRR